MSGSEGFSARFRGRYWVFVGDNYYPSGGMGDFLLSTDDLEEAKAKALEAKLWFSGGRWSDICDMYKDENI